MTVRERDSKSAVFAFADNQCTLVMQQVEGHLDRAEAFGRLACECPAAEVRGCGTALNIHTTTAIIDRVGGKRARRRQGSNAARLARHTRQGRRTSGDSCRSGMFQFDDSFMCTTWARLKDGHEICFVGMEAFAQLSEVDPKAAALLQEGESKCAVPVHRCVCVCRQLPTTRAWSD